MNGHCFDAKKSSLGQKHQYLCVKLTLSADSSQVRQQESALRHTENDASLWYSNLVIWCCLIWRTWLNWISCHSHSLTHIDWPLILPLVPNYSPIAFITTYISYYFTYIMLSILQGKIAQIVMKSINLGIFQMNKLPSIMKP